MSKEDRIGGGANERTLIDVVQRVSQHITRALTATPQDVRQARQALDFTGATHQGRLDLSVAANLLILWAQPIALVLAPAELVDATRQEAMLLHGIVWRFDQLQQLIMAITADLDDAGLRDLVLLTGGHHAAALDVLGGRRAYEDTSTVVAATDTQTPHQAKYQYAAIALAAAAAAGDPVRFDNMLARLDNRPDRTEAVTATLALLIRCAAASTYMIHPTDPVVELADPRLPDPATDEFLAAWPSDSGGYRLVRDAITSSNRYFAYRQRPPRPIDVPAADEAAPTVRYAATVVARYRDRVIAQAVRDQAAALDPDQPAP
ncbi:hypothetical protein [Actinoplanes sp. NPDC051411]|uniref:hypothetical protein n=1 Tax=Actinoplanes sp. NPDC051411 TaxID=3155522 RepID=UPI00343B7BB7